MVCLPSMPLYSAMVSLKTSLQSEYSTNRDITYDFLSLFGLRFSGEALGSRVGLLPGLHRCRFFLERFRDSSTITPDQYRTMRWAHNTRWRAATGSALQFQQTLSVTLKRASLLMQWRKEAQLCRDHQIADWSQELRSAVSGTVKCVLMRVLFFFVYWPWPQAPQCSLPTHVTLHSRWCSWHWSCQTNRARIHVCWRSQEVNFSSFKKFHERLNKNKKTCQEACQEIRRFPCLWDPHQANPPSTQSWSLNGWFSFFHLFSCVLTIVLQLENFLPLSPMPKIVATRLGLCVLAMHSSCSQIMRIVHGRAG